MLAAFAIHVIAGSLVLLFGYITLYSAKGGRLHRRSGMVFVFSMLTMTAFGALLAALGANAWSVVNIAAALTTAYLVITALTTVRTPAGWTRRLDVGLTVMALIIGLTMLTFGVEAVSRGGTWNGVPAFPFFLFGSVGLVAGAADIRVLRSGALQGTARLARHLWRMSFALLIAAMSFFFGQAQVIPKPIRIMPLLALPVVAVLVTMMYWTWRVRIRRSFRGIVGVSTTEPVAARIGA